MKTATFLCVLEDTPNRKQEHYRLDPPLDGKEYVVVSALNVAFDHKAAETFIFPANKTGDITGWLEMEGSFRGAADHAEALRRAGYEIQKLTKGDGEETVTDPAIDRMEQTGQRPGETARDHEPVLVTATITFMAERHEVDDPREFVRMQLNTDATIGDVEVEDDC
jgi:hypothetical protein